MKRVACSVEIKLAFFKVVFTARRSISEERNIHPYIFIVNNVDENMNPVRMADMIDGRPLVMFFSSCT